VRRHLLSRDFSLNELGKQCERLLPAEIAGLDGNGLRYSFLHDVQFGSTEHLRKRHSDLHRAGQVRVVELVGVTDPFVRDQLKVLSSEGVAESCREGRERHLESAADLGVQVVDLAGEAVWREPLDHCIRVEEGSIDSFWGCAEHVVKSDRACRHDECSFQLLVLRDEGVVAPNAAHHQRIWSAAEYAPSACDC